MRDSWVISQGLSIINKKESKICMLSPCLVKAGSGLYFMPKKPLKKAKSSTLTMMLVDKSLKIFPASMISLRKPKSDPIL